jgi:hypothetical protein
MTKPNSLDPPKLATWLIEQFSPILQNAPLAGDLMEAFKEGRSAAWYWRQAFWAILIGLLNLFGKRWGRLAYAVVCGTLIYAAWFCIFPVAGRYTAQGIAVSCDGHIWFGPVQTMGPSSALPAVVALYAKSYKIAWPWSLVYQVAFLTAFQAIVVAFALGAYVGFARIQKIMNFLGALMLVVVVLASINVAATFLSIPPSDIRVSSYSVSRIGWWVLVSTPAMFALLLGMRQTKLSDDSSRPLSA